jgi:precorrin-6B methylase 2
VPDIYTNVTQAAPSVLESLMTTLELRAADPQQRAMLTTYLADAALPPRARVLEVGCGTGAVTRTLAAEECWVPKALYRKGPADGA